MKHIVKIILAIITGFFGFYFITSGANISLSSHSVMHQIYAQLEVISGLILLAICCNVSFSK